MPLCARLNLHILQGDKVVEIKSPRFTKGSETLRLLRQERYDFILALGDDTTDDDMFAALPPRALSIKIGNASEHARYNMPEPRQFRPGRRETRDPHDMEQSEKTGGRPPNRGIWTRT